MDPEESAAAFLADEPGFHISDPSHIRPGSQELLGQLHLRIDAALAVDRKSPRRIVRRPIPDLQMIGNGRWIPLGILAAHGTRPEPRKIESLDRARPSL